jgi:hypothetical protein
MHLKFISLLAFFYNIIMEMAMKFEAILARMLVPDRSIPFMATSSAVHSIPDLKCEPPEQILCLLQCFGIVVSDQQRN